MDKNLIKQVNVKTVGCPAGSNNSSVGGNTGGGGDTPIEINLTEDNVLDYICEEIIDTPPLYVVSFVIDSPIDIDKKISVQTDAKPLCMCGVTFWSGNGSTNITLLTSLDVPEEIFVQSGAKLVIS